VYNVFEGVKHYNCELWGVGGVPIDKIMCISCLLFEIINDSFDERITIQQSFYLLHFLMNQLDFSYNEELQLYTTLAINIEETIRQIKKG